MMQTSMYAYISKKKFIGVCVLSLFVSLFVLKTYSWIRHGDYWLIASRNDPGDIVRVFTLSLMQNRSSTAKALVVEEQWPEIDSWIASHLAVRCNFPLDGDTFLLGGIERSHNEENKGYIYDSIVSVPCERYLRYSLFIEEITLQPTEQGLKVTSWGPVCEEWIDNDDKCLFE